MWMAPVYRSRRVDHGVDGVVTEEGDVALEELRAAALHHPLGGPPVEGVVLLAAVDPDGGPHPMIVREDAHARGPHDLEDRQVGGDVDALDLRLGGGQRLGDGLGLGDGPNQHLLDGEAGLRLLRRGDAVSGEPVEVEHRGSFRSGAPVWLSPRWPCRSHSHLPLPARHRRATRPGTPPPSPPDRCAPSCTSRTRTSRTW